MTKIKPEIDIMVCTKDRHSETALLLQSLRAQTYQNFTITILDDASGTPIMTAEFINKLLNRMMLENHYVKVLRNEVSHGVCAARNQLIDDVAENLDGELLLRLDDDCILEPDYIEKLLRVLNWGYDIATGIVPNIETPRITRELSRVMPIISRIDINSKGELTHVGDDLGFGYTDHQILPTHHFRTNALYKRSIIDIKYPDTLTKTGFREETMFSLEAIKRGRRLGCHTGAVAWHLRTGSGGTRSPEYAENVQLDEQTFRAWVKKNYKKIRKGMSSR